ncbi:MAG TPA: tetratricopeptide repeat protein, partial [Planctomycetota bacterium]|nr:tetratricopeptide repeat protein [Planctomycetota bacterium]
LLDRHVASTVKDSEDPEMIVRERAADELFLLGGRGIAALEQRLATPPRATEGGGQPRPVEAGAGQDFLLGLLRWRIRPRTFARTGIDFEDYATLMFREKRRRIFDYAHVAEEEAVPTLKAIVMNDTLEPSLLVKLAAAKALAGLRDMSGYNFLAIKHPDLTLKKPEVSRELLIIQGFEHIRDKDYQRAVEEFRKILDEFPFDFRANYHIAFAYLLLQNYAKAIHHVEIARRISPRDQLTLYNLACAYALSGGKATEAIEALEASVEAGFDDYQHIENDPDLESLRKDTRYQRVVDGLKSSGSPGPKRP